MDACVTILYRKFFFSSSYNYRHKNYHIKTVVMSTFYQGDILQSPLFTLVKIKDFSRIFWLLCFVILFLLSTSPHIQPIVQLANDECGK